MKMPNKLVVCLLALFFISFIAAGIELENKVLLNDKIELKIPKSFTIMGEEMMKLKYPSERRPTLIYTNSSGGINVALNLTANKASQELITTYQENLYQVFSKMYPSATWFGKGVEQINGRKVGFIELMTPAVDTQIYNLIFFTDLDGQLLLCTFNCTEKDIPNWKASAKEIMKSLKVK